MVAARAAVQGLRDVGLDGVEKHVRRIFKLYSTITVKYTVFIQCGEHMYTEK